MSASERMTVLEALAYIYEEIDPTLAFRFGCRFDKCGLCAVEVNGKPRMGCLTPIRAGMKIGPLPGMPVVRDLVIDRARFFQGLQELALFVPEPEDVSEPQVLHQSETQKKLLGCVECLACNATCPEYDFDRNPFAGPYVLTKLAQLHGDSRTLFMHPFDNFLPVFNVAVIIHGKGVGSALDRRSFFINRRVNERGCGNNQADLAFGKGMV